MRIHDSVDELGLVQINPDVQTYSYTSIIKESKSLKIVMNDGQRWIGNNSVSLGERFSNNTETIFFTVQHDSEFAPVLAKKTDKTINELKDKIKDS